MQNPFQTQITLRAEPVTPRGRWRRRLLWGGLGALGLLVVLYFFFTSALFFRGYILPRIGKALNAEVEAGSIGFSLFGDLRLGDLRLTTLTGQQPLLTAKEVRIEVDWWDFLRGNRRLDAMHAKHALVNVVVDDKGRSNLDPLLKALSEIKSGKKKAELHNLRFDHLTLRHTRDDEVTELALAQFTLDHWTPNAAGTAKLKGNVARRHAADKLSMGLTVNTVFGLDAQGRPHILKLNGQAVTQQATGAYKYAAQLSAVIRGELTPEELKTLSIDFTQANQSLGRIAVHGPLDLIQGEGQLTCVVQSIDRRVLNILGASRGLDFGATVVNGTNKVTLAGRQWAVSGPFHAHNFSVTRDGRTTPPLELSSHVDAQLNLDARTLKLKTLNILGVRQRQRLLAASLSAPMHLSWGEGGAKPANARLQVNIDNANLAEWQPFLGAYAKAGMLTAELRLRYTGSSQRLTFGVGATGLGIQPTISDLPTVNLSLRAQGQVENLRTLSLEHYRLQVLEGKRELVLATGQGEVDLREHWLDTTTELSASLQWVAALVKRSAFTAEAGKAGFKGQLACRLGKGKPDRPELLRGRLEVTNYRGTMAGRTLRDVAANWETEVTLKNRRAGTVTEGTVHLNNGGQPAGTVTFRADFDLMSKTAKMAFTGSRLNQDVIRPWLPPLPGGRILQNASVEASGQASMGPGKQLSISCNASANSVQLTNPDKQLEHSRMSFQMAAKGVAARSAGGVWSWTLANLKGRVVRDATAVGGFSATGSNDIGKQTSQLGFAIDNMDAAAWAPFLIGYLKGWQLEAGQVKGTGTATWTAAGSVVRVKIDLDNSRWRDYTGALAPHLISAVVGLELNSPKEGAGWLWALKGAMKSGNKACGKVDLSGVYNPATGPRRFGGTVEDVTEQLIGPLLAARLGKNRLMKGLFSVSGGVFNGDGVTQVKGMARFEGLQILDEAGIRMGLPQFGRLTLDGEVKQKVWTLHQAELALANKAETKDVVNFTGRLDRSRPDELGGELKLTSGRLDLGLLKGWIEAWPLTTKGKPIRWRDLTLECSVRRAIRGPNTISNLEGSVKLNGAEYSLTGIRAVVNGAPIKLDADWKLAGLSPFVKVEAWADGVPVGSLVDTFLPDLKGKITGKLHLNAHFQSSGTNVTSLLRSLDGNATMGLLEARIRPVRDKANRSGIIGWIGEVEGLTYKIMQVSSMINRLGQMNPLGKLSPEKLLKLDKLPLFPKEIEVDNKQDITAVKVILNAGNGRIENKLEWKSAGYRAETHGDVPLNEGWPPPLNQPISIFLPAASAKILRLPILPGRGEETRLPHDFYMLTNLDKGKPTNKIEFKLNKGKLSKNFPASFFSKLPLLKLLFRD